MWVVVRLWLSLAVYLVCRFFWRRPPSDAEGGGELVYRWGELSQGEKPGLWFGTPYAQPVLFGLSPESAWDRWCKDAGLASEAQLGAADFDRLVYVACDHAAFALQLKRSAAARDAIVALLRQHGARRVFNDGAYLWVHSGSGRGPGAGERRELWRLRSALGDAPLGSSAWESRFCARALSFEAGIWAIACYGAVGWVEALLRSNPLFPQHARLFAMGFAAALALLAALLGLFAVGLRGSSRGPRVLAQSWAALALALAVAGVPIAADLDVYLDRRPAIAVEARVLDTVITGGVSQRSRRYWLQLRWPPDALGSGLEWFRVERGVFDRVRRGDAVRFAVHPGALGVPWTEPAIAAELVRAPAGGA